MAYNFNGITTSMKNKKLSIFPEKNFASNIFNIKNIIISEEKKITIFFFLLIFFIWTQLYIYIDIANKMNTNNNDRYLFMLV